MKTFISTNQEIQMEAIFNAIPWSSSSFLIERQEHIALQVKVCILTNNRHFNLKDDNNYITSLYTHTFQNVEFTCSILRDFEFLVRIDDYDILLDLTQDIIILYLDPGESNEVMMQEIARSESSNDLIIYEVIGGDSRDVLTLLDNEARSRRIVSKVVDIKRRRRKL
jgi:hypothetical protein